MNANEIIKGALRKLVVIPAGGTPTVSQYADGLEVFNDLVSSWSANSSLIYEDTLEEIALSAATQSFTLGTTGDYVTGKPVELISASLKNSNHETPLEIAGEKTYQNLRDKTRTGLPFWIYFRNTHPNSTFYFDKTTDQAYTLILTSMKELTQFPDGTTEIVLPDMYKKAFKDNLTLELAPGSGAAKRVTPLMVEQAKESKAAVLGKSLKINPSRTELSNNNRRVDGDHGRMY